MYRLRIGTALFVFCFCAISSRAEVVFDTLSNADVGGMKIGGGVNSLDGVNSDFAQPIVLAGTARDVTRLEVMVAATGTNTYDVTGVFYRLGGPGGGPGSMLWSGTADQIKSANRERIIVAIEVPHVLVPDSFAWGVFAYDVQPPDGQVMVNAATGVSVGAATSAWTNNSHSWSLNPSIANAIFVARINAVPEPAMGVVAILTFAAVKLWHPCSRR